MLTPAGNATCTGVVLLRVPPLSPSPNWLMPHAQSVPSDLSASVKPLPAAAAVTPLMLGTCTGAAYCATASGVISCSLLSPQPHNEPSAPTANASLAAWPETTLAMP